MMHGQKNIKLFLSFKGCHKHRTFSYYFRKFSIQFHTEYATVNEQHTSKRQLQWHWINDYKRTITKRNQTQSCEIWGHHSVMI